MNWRVPLADLDYNEAEQQAVLEVLKSRWLTMGSVTQEFERCFAEAIGVKHALAVSNATTALHLACLALGVGPGDEVIVPSLTFVATANAVLYTGGDVVFADIQGEDDLTIAPDEIEKRITPRAKAIIVMHYGGYACDMPAILEIANRYGLKLIEDAAHAPGASLSGRALGAWGDVGCFSFFSNKNLSTGEGGMLVTNRDEIADRVRKLRSHGMTSLTWDRHQGHAYSYDVVELGYNYRIDEIRSALGLVQLGKLRHNNQKRAEISGMYRQRLLNSGVELPFSKSWGESAHHLQPILLPPGSDQQKFMELMRSEGIQTSIHYPPVHQFSYYRSRYPDVSLPKTEEVATREVTLPLYPSMEETDVELVVAAVLHSMGQAIDIIQDGGILG